MSLRESIIEKFVSLATPVLVGGVYRSREAAIARGEGSAIVIRPDEEKVEMRADRVALRDLTVKIDVIVRGLIPDQDADPIVANLHAAIMADNTLGGLVYRVIEESTKWEFEVADMNGVAIEILYRCRYLTQANSLTNVP